MNLSKRMILKGFPVCFWTSTLRYWIYQLVTPAFYFNFKNAFYGEIEPLSASGVIRFLMSDSLQHHYFHMGISMIQLRNSQEATISALQMIVWLKQYMLLSILDGFIHENSFSFVVCKVHNLSWTKLYISMLSWCLFISTLAKLFPGFQWFPVVFSGFWVSGNWETWKPGNLLHYLNMLGARLILSTKW